MDRIMRHSWAIVVGAACLLFPSCNGQKESHGGTIEEVEFVKGVEDKDNVESPSMYDERYGTPIDDKEGNPKDDLVKDPTDEIAVGADGFADVDSYESGGDGYDY